MGDDEGEDEGKGKVEGKGMGKSKGKGKGKDEGKLTNPNLASAARNFRPDAKLASSCRPPANQVAPGQQQSQGGTGGQGVNRRCCLGRCSESQKFAWAVR